MMRRSFLLFIFLILVAFSGLIMAGLHNESPPPAADFTGEFPGQIDFIESRFTQLLEAMPAKDFDWRPEEGVRSVGEVYMHAAFANYLFIKISGQMLPGDINIDMKPMDWDKTVSGKEAISRVLKRSFNDLREAAKNISEMDLDNTVKFFGNEMSLRNFMVVSLNHLHEHLGQSIAYARMNGITPPWTAAQQKAESK